MNTFIDTSTKKLFTVPRAFLLYIDRKRYKIFMQICYAFTFNKELRGQSWAPLPLYFVFTGHLTMDFVACKFNCKSTGVLSHYLHIGICL